MKVVLITGVSSGFGLAIAQRLAKSNYKVYGSVRNDVNPISGINYLRMDVTQPDSVEQAVKKIYEREGRIDVLINNAGCGIAGPIEFTKISEAQHQMDVNFFGVFRVTQAVLPIMRKKGEGLIICISSIGGLIGLPFQGLYSASKFAVEGYCQALRLEVKTHNIRIVLVNPGDFATNFTSNRKIIRNTDSNVIYPKFQKTLSIIKHDEQNGLNSEVLANKIEKIIRKKTPAPGYIVASPLQKVSVYLKKILPEVIFFNLLGRYYNV
jgi:short-subunit dehydrogenase